MVADALRDVWDVWGEMVELELGIGKVLSQFAMHSISPRAALKDVDVDCVVYLFAEIPSFAADGDKSIAWCVGREIKLGTRLFILNHWGGG